MSQDVDKTQQSSNKKPEAKADFEEPGLRHARTTNVFRMVNFELFAKPNKRVMGLGGAVFLGACAYIFYMRISDAYRDTPMYTTINEDGTFGRREKKSKWD